MWLMYLLYFITVKGYPMCISLLSSQPYHELALTVALAYVKTYTLCTNYLNLTAGQFTIIMPILVHLSSYVLLPFIVFQQPLCMYLPQHICISLISMCIYWPQDLSTRRGVLSPMPYMHKPQGTVTPVLVYLLHFVLYVHVCFQ